MRRTLVALACLVMLETSAARACEALRRVAVPIETRLGLWTVAASVNGKPASFVLDTGAERTTVSTAAVRRLGLARDQWVSSMIGGVGGVEWQANAEMRSFDLGGVALRRRAVDTRLTFVVAPLPWLDQGADPVTGLLGADYLSTFDLEIDAAGRLLTLYSMRGCDGGAIPWDVPHVVLPAIRPRPYVLLVPVRIDGVELQAQLDTGASRSLVTRRGAARLGLKPETLAGERQVTAQGIGRQAMPLGLHRFAELRFGPLVLRDVDIPVGTPAGGYPFDMLLGRDVLQHAQVWISYATGRVLVALPKEAATVR